MGTFTSARRHVLHSFATTQSALMKRRVAQYMIGAQCPVCIFGDAAAAVKDEGTQVVLRRRIAG